jgi:hypothetical protein
MQMLNVEGISRFELAIEELPGGDLTVTMLNDGKPFGEDCVDLVDLKRSALGSGAYDLQTCDCGTPRCAGFWEPIFVEHFGDIVRWEFDDRYHPIVRDEDETELTVTRYEFNRKQYITEIQEKFKCLRNHPRKGSLGPYGFDPAIFDDEFPCPSATQLPFEKGAKIVVGYTDNYQQPWVWVENNPVAYPRQLIPTGAMWASFGCWSLMWGSDLYDLGGPCIYRKDSIKFELSTEVTISECNEEAESLAREIQKYWGSVVHVVWDKVIETSPRTFVRSHLAAEALNQG